MEGFRILVREALTSSNNMSVDPLESSSSSPAAGNDNSNQDTGGSSPLLFFVALGFGLVFTNLWIIVGAKYCFRYNARQRQLRMTGDGNPINLENMPRTHRRRREKKLMTMDEVNERFPMVKYKAWVAGRARAGLPTEGGVSVLPSRASSVRSVKATMATTADKLHSPNDEKPATTSTLPSPGDEDCSQSKTTTTATTATTPAEKQEKSEGATASPRSPSLRSASPAHDAAYPACRASEDEEDEQIDAALPAEYLENGSGDTCAICIDTLETDDDVRGLTCGHAFHAVCLDPWLTSRRACCPLCKADYYTPKPRPPAPLEAAGDGSADVIIVTIPNDPNHPGMPGGISHMPTTWGEITRFILPRRFTSSAHSQDLSSPTRLPSNSADSSRRDSRPRAVRALAIPTQPNSPGTLPPPATETSPLRNSTYQHQGPVGGFLGSIRAALPFGERLDRARRTNLPDRAGGPVASGANPTPSQLEAGAQ